jgi:sRNA-binding protein
MSEPTEPAAAEAALPDVQTPAAAAPQAPDQDLSTPTTQTAPQQAESAHAAQTETVAVTSAGQDADDDAPFAVDTPAVAPIDDATPGDGESEGETSATPSASDAVAQAGPAAGGAAAEMGPAACAARLGELFPALFGGDGPPRPVKLRIHADIQQRAPGVFTRKALSIFLHRHTTGNAYVRALLSAPHRFDLDGQPAGEIAEEHRAAAREELERRRQIHMARRAAERSATGRPPGPPRGPEAAAGDGGTPSGARPERSGRPPRGTAPEGQRGPRPARGRPGDQHRPAQDQPPQPQEQGAQRPPPHGMQGRGGGEGHGDRPPGRPPGPHQGGGRDRGDAGARDARMRRPMRAGRPAQNAGPGNAHAFGPSDGERSGHRRADDRGRDRAPLAEAPVAGPEDAARRDRASLLRTFEASSLSKANFCVLKRITEADLDAVLAQARRERDERGPRPMAPAA